LDLIVEKNLLPNGYNIRGCGDNKFVENELKSYINDEFGVEPKIPLKK